MDTLKNFFSPEVLWFIAGIVLLIIELSAPSFFIFFFGVGAIVVGVVCLIFDPSLTVQLVIFLSSSLLLLISLRKWLKKVFFGRSRTAAAMDDMTDNYVGEKAIVIKNISPNLPGAVELHGTRWKAESNQTIKEKTPVKITGKSNLVLTVKPIKNNKKEV